MSEENIQFTVISFDTSLNNITNVDDLPAPLKEELLSTPRLEVRGFQEILGSKDRRLVLSLGGYWDEDKFTITSYGSRTYQWSNSKPTEYTVKTEEK